MNTRSQPLRPVPSNDDLPINIVVPIGRIRAFNKGHRGQLQFSKLRAHGARLSKEYRLANDGRVEKDSSTQLSGGAAEVVAIDLAAGIPAALTRIGQHLEALKPFEAIALGVLLDGRRASDIVTKARHSKGNTTALARSKEHFVWPAAGSPGLLLLDGDDRDNSRDIAIELYPPIAEVAMLIRPSASASIIDPKTGTRLKSGEHAYVVIDDPSRSKDVLHALLRLSWVVGKGRSAGFPFLNKAGSVQPRGPFDDSVGSPERLSYEGAAIVDPRLQQIPRNCTVSGGDGMLIAADLIAFADQHAPEAQFRERFEEAKHEPEFAARCAAMKAEHRKAHIKTQVARGKSRKQAAAEYDGTDSIPVRAVGDRTYKMLPPGHTLYWPNGDSFTVEDIQRDPSAFHQKACADPIEGLDYQTKNCGWIVSEGDAVTIYSQAHGGSYAYTVPIDYSKTPLAAALRKLQNQEQADDTTPPRPVIKIGPLSKMADAAAQILQAAKAPFYQRGNKLVRPVVVPLQTFGGAPTNTAQLVEVELPYLRDVLCQNSSWVKFDKRAKKWLPTHPPTDAAQVLLKRYGDWTFPVIAGIISTPTLRPDGTVLAQAGYDPATQLLLLDPPPMPEISEHPTEADAQAALQLLKDLLAEFPFTDNVSRAVGLSAQISTVCRGAYPVQPMHVIDAPTAGSGKSYLLSCVSRIATGQAMPVISTGKDEQELEKRLGAAVIHGQALICIDNVVGEIGGGALCQLIDQPRPSVRVLGQSLNVEIDARSTSFFGNGNNIIIVGDLCRRVIRCRLDPKVEQPELRTFKNRPKDLILANRGAYIAACLTICRAYIAAGRPDRKPPLGSFEEWSDIVRSALTWLGEADPVKSMETSRLEDPQVNVLLAMLTEWRKEFGSGAANARTLRDVIDYCDRNRPLYYGNGITKDYLHPGLRSAVLGAMPVQHSLKPDVTALGYWLRGNKDRRIGKMRFMNRVDPGGHKPTVWWVETE